MQAQQMPKELKDIIDIMMAEGLGEDEIKSTIDWFHNSKNPSKPPVVTPTRGNTSFVPGKDKTVLDAMGEGAKGWLKGAVNLPKTIMGGIESLMHPIDAISSIPEGIGSMWDTAKQAGSNPDAFGQMMGEMGGQPLLTAGLAKAVPPTLRGVGGVMEKKQPISGMLPRLAEPRTMRNIEAGLGGGLRRIGERMAPSVPPSPVPNVAGSGIPPINPALLRSVGNQGSVDIPGDNFARPMSNTTGGPSNIPTPPISAIQEMLTPESKFAKPTSSGSGVPPVNQSFDDLINELGVKGGDVELLDLDGPIINGSGDSMASMEAINRGRAMKSKGQQYVVYDSSGNRRPIIGPEAVDYQVQLGESFGIEGPGGFQLLDNAGGKIPQKGAISATTGASSTAPPQFMQTNIPPPPPIRGIPKPKHHSITIKIIDKGGLVKAYQKGYRIDTSYPISDTSGIKLIKPIGR